MFKKHIHYSQELEQAVLGACMLEYSAFSRIYGILKPETFYMFGHQEVFSAMAEMYDSGAPIDTFTVVDYLTRKRGFEHFHGYNVLYFVTRLTNCVVNTAHLEYHASIIKAMWMDRELITLTSSGAGDGDTRKKIADLQERLHQLNQSTQVNDWQDMTALMVDLYRHQDDMQKSGGMGITTGFKRLDSQTGGFHKGQLIVIGARPSVGKSALAGQMAVGMARDGVKVGIISLEMNNNEIAARIAAIDTDTDFNVLFRGLYQDERQRERVYNRIAQSTSRLPIFVSDKTSVNINEIRAKAMKIQHAEGLDCLMIDYLQLIDSDESKHSNRENEIRKISRGAKIMAKEMEIPVIELCQLNREVTRRKGGDRYPQLSDLRESGAIEQDADVVIFLHRDWMAGFQQDENGHSTERQADLVIRKWRNGNANYIVPMDFDPPKMKFSERQDINLSGWRPARDINEPSKDTDMF
jgi:replicative DNA helicase